MATCVAPTSVGATSVPSQVRHLCEDLGAACAEAAPADHPVILNIYADPNAPPWPPYITLKDAKNFMTLSEPELGNVLKTAPKNIGA